MCIFTEWVVGQGSQPYVQLPKATRTHEFKERQPSDVCTLPDGLRSARVLFRMQQGRDDTDSCPCRRDHAADVQ